MRVCQQLSDKPNEVTDQQIDVILKFVLKVYYPQKLQAASLEAQNVDQYKLIASNDIRKLPLSRAGLTEHIKRACIKGGWLWRKCFNHVF